MGPLANRIRVLHSLGPQSFKFAMQAIRIQKLRAFLTLLGIMAGVTTVIAMVSLVAGFNQKVLDAFQSFGASLVSIQKYDYSGEMRLDQFKPRRNLEVEDAQAIQKLAPMAAYVSPERYVLGGAGITVKGPKGDEIQAPILVGGLPAYSVVNNFTLSDGRHLTDPDIRHASRVCALGSSSAQTLFPGRDPILKDIFIQGTPFKVVGVFQAKGKMFGSNPDNVVLIPITAFDEVFPFVKAYFPEPLTINVTPRTATGSEVLKDQCISILRVRRGLRPKDPNDFQVVAAEAELKSLQKIIDRIASVMLLIASIALLVAGVGVMNIMLVSVTERTREIGIRKALGATRAAIAMQFLVEAVALTGVGGAFGIALGIGAAMLVKIIWDFPAAAPLWSILLGFGVSTFVGLTFGLWPAVSAARKDPIEALRFE